MIKKSKNFLAEAKSWTSKHKLHGPHAFRRFVMLVFVDRLNKHSNEFILKGGNLLWVYINTPRATIDLDFVTAKLSEHDSVKQALEGFCKLKHPDVTFSLLEYKPVEIRSQKGAAVTIGYITQSGQENKIDLDIVYALESDSCEITSPIDDNEKIKAVTMENIIADKLAAAQAFKGGNTRMKDYDDLWRIAQFTPETIDWLKLKGILEERNIAPSLSEKWINDQMLGSWKAHLRRNKGLPKYLEELFSQINNWLRMIKR